MVNLIYGELPKDLGSGYGSGDGYGYGSGDGYGYGYGEGYGYGYGEGYGEGDGSGYGSGYGEGDGSGYGYGYGEGYGEGDGSGSGDGSLKYALEGFVSGLPEDLQSRVKKLEASGARLAYWKSDSNGMPSNGGTLKQPVEVGMLQEVPGPLLICTRNALHATYIPLKWKGDRLWLVALIGEVQEQEDKLAALKREIIADITPKDN